MQFIWSPYSQAVISILPPSCLISSDIWMARIPLICFDVVEWHLPDRVLRQFGYRQSIPIPCDTSVHLHQIDRRGRTNASWDAVHGTYIATWNARRQHIIMGDPIVGGVACTPDYMAWFRSITRICVGRSEYSTSGYEGEGSSYEFLHERFHQLTMEVERAIVAPAEAERLHILRSATTMAYGTLSAIGHQHVRSTPDAAPYPEGSESTRADPDPTMETFHYTPSPSRMRSPVAHEYWHERGAGEGTSASRDHTAHRIDDIADADITEISEDLTRPYFDAAMPDVSYPTMIPTQEGVSQVIDEGLPPLNTYRRRTGRIRRPPRRGCGT